MPFQLPAHVIGGRPSPPEDVVVAAVTAIQWLIALDPGPARQFSEAELLTVAKREDQLETPNEAWRLFFLQELHYQTLIVMGRWLLRAGAETWHLCPTGETVPLAEADVVACLKRLTDHVAFRHRTIDRNLLTVHERQTAADAHARTGQLQMQSVGKRLF